MYAVLHIADFALHAVLRTDRAATPDRPAALFDGTRKKSLALAVNPAARGAGVEVGMTAPQAVARCPALCIRTPNAEAESEARAALLATGFLLSPTIEDTAPGVCTVDLRGAQPASTTAAAEAAIAELARLDLPATAGIARTPLLALYAARAGGAAPEVSTQGSEVRFQKAGGERRANGELESRNPPGADKPETRQRRASPKLAGSRQARPPRAASHSEPRTQNSAGPIQLEPVEAVTTKSLKGGARCSSGRSNGSIEHGGLGSRPHHLQQRRSNSELGTQNSELALGAPVVEESPADYGSRIVHVVVDEKGFLAPLPLAAAEPPPVLADVFASWGLRTLGDFTALPRDEIVRRFGTEGLRFWQRAHGGEPRPLHPVAPPQEFAAKMEFEEPVETLEPLLFILRRFLDRLSLELRAAHFVAAELALTLPMENGHAHTRGFRLPEPTADTEILFRALFTHLESLHTDSPIVGVRLQVTPARPLVRQQGLFETGLRDPHGFAETLARVVAIVGNDRVGTPQREDTHRPDAVKLAPPAAVVPPPAPPPIHPPVGLPLRRFRPALPATLELTDGRPTYVSAGQIHGAVAEIRGPWRSSGDWWQDDRVWNRIEYDIALAGGGLYRLLLTGDAWFLEGEYD